MSDITAAGAVANGGARGTDSEILATARSRLNMAISAYSESREDEIDDLRFFAGSPDNHWQWPADVLATRGAVQGQTINARPCLTINKLPKHVRQVTNDQRQNRPSGKVIPADDKADLEVAEVFNGMVRHIEYISDADVAYDTACENPCAELIIDTSHTSVYQLRDAVRGRVGLRTEPTLSILIQSFGYKHGIPLDADFVFDLRCLPNPYWEMNLRPLTGLDAPVVEYLESHENVRRMYDDLAGFLDHWIPKYIDFHRNYLTIALGCTGGQHRSVYMAEKIAASLSKKYPQVLIRHNELRGVGRSAQAGA